MTQNSYRFEQELLRKNTPRLRFRSTEDFSQWQMRAKDRLIKLLSLDSFEPCSPCPEICREKDLGSCSEIQFTFQSEAGYRVPCRILLPRRKNPVPVLCLQGHSTGMHISLGRPKYPGDEETIRGGDRDFAVRAVQEGFAAVTMEQRYMGECGGNEKGPACCRGAALPALLLGRCAIGERVWDAMRLIDVLEQSFARYFSTENLICMGNSGGGTSTFYTACLDRRIRTAIVSCAFCTYQDSIVAMEHCACNYIPGIAGWFDMGDLSGLIAPRRLLVVAGKEDPIFPLDGVRKSFAVTSELYRAAGCPQNCRLVVGEGAHRFYAEDAWRAYREMISSVPAESERTT